MIEAWKIGVNIAMTSNASQVLGVLGRDLLGLGKAADALTGKLNAVKVAAWGAAGVLGGGAILGGLGKLAEKGAELVHQQALFKSALLDSGKTAQQIAADVNDATQKAWQATQQVPGTTWAGNLQSIRELRTVFGNTQVAEQQLPNLLKANMVLQSLLPGSGAGDQVFDLAKALEIKGKSMDPQQFNVMLGEFIQAEIASGGKITGRDFLSTFKYGRTATQSWSDEFVGQYLPTLIQEMKTGGTGGNGGPGNALQSAFQAVVGGTMSNKAAEEFFKLHLVDPHKVIYTRTGSVKGIERAVRERLFRDFEFYAQHALFIRTKQTQVVPLVLNRAQKRLLAAVIGLERRGFVRLIILKGRQMGSSTFVDAFLYWWVSQSRAQRALVVTHDASAASTIFEMTERFHDKCPEILASATARARRCVRCAPLPKRRGQRGWSSVVVVGRTTCDRKIYVEAPTTAVCAGALRVAGMTARGFHESPGRPSVDVIAWSWPARGAPLLRPRPASWSRDTPLGQLVCDSVKACGVPQRCLDVLDSACQAVCGAIRRAAPGFRRSLRAGAPVRRSSWPVAA